MKKGFLWMLLIALLACKKDKSVTITFEGTVTDGVNGGGVSDVAVTLSYQAYEGGVASSAFTSAGTLYTNANGWYSFTFKKPAAIKYKIVLSRNAYFGITQEMNPDNFTTEHNNTLNYTLYPSATFHIGIKNQTPFNSQDQIVFQYIGENTGCPTCCNNLLKTFTGTAVDTSLTCLRQGDNYVKFQWLVTKNSLTNLYSDSVLCPKGVVTTYQINY